MPNGDTAETTETAAPAPNGKPFNITPVARFDEPWAMAFLPDGRLLVTEKKGALKLRAPDGEIVPVNGVPDVAYSSQGGLLDIAVAPDFARSGLVYLTYAEPGPGGSSLALARGRLASGEDGGYRLENLHVIWRQLPKGKGGQFGAIIAFAPDGQSLFLSSGERQRFTPAQDPNQALGKVLHLTLDGQPAPGNPCAGQTGATTVTVIDPPEDTETAKTAKGRTVTLPGPNLTPAETWTLGHRNPYGLAFDAGGRLWEIEMGPKGGDELNLILKGKNYGWPVVSNGDNYNGVPIPDHSTHPEFEPPKVWWTPSISPAGLIIYSGKLFPQWRGDAFLGALSGEALVRVDLDGGNAQKGNQWDMGQRIRDVAEGPDGAIWLLEDDPGGRLLKLTPAR